jgi:hypothetical protein
VLDDRGDSLLHLATKGKDINLLKALIAYQEDYLKRQNSEMLFTVNADQAVREWLGLANSEGQLLSHIAAERGSIPIL